MRDGHDRDLTIFANESSMTQTDTERGGCRLDQREPSERSCHIVAWTSVSPGSELSPTIWWAAFAERAELLDPPSVPRSIIPSACVQRNA